MSMFLTYDAENYEYLLQPAGYVVLALILVALLACIHLLSKKKASRQMKTKELVFCSVSIALATVASFIKPFSLPFGGSITLFSMLFVVLIGYFYGPKTGLITGLAYGILQLISDPYIYSPLQVLLDFPLAFGALGLSGFFQNKKHGLILGYIVGVTGRYLCHVISGYVFFADYAPEGMNPMLYTLGYNMTYILPEMIATIIILCIPAVAKAVSQVKKQACA
ncbi:MAG: energy-coupled thiamine transporter ThiT [Lachnospiraceae bacterium]|nr:energy-coupled thiamine transporter ThiT [Lachnospiraceae bacterium]